MDRLYVMLCKSFASFDIPGIYLTHLLTDRFAEMIVKQVIHSDTYNVIKNNDLTDEEV